MVCRPKPSRPSHRSRDPRTARGADFPPRLVLRAGRNFRPHPRDPPPSRALAGKRGAVFVFASRRPRAAVSGNYSYVPPALQGLYPGEYEVVLYPRAFGDTQGEAGQAFAVSVFRISSWTLIVGESLQVRDHLRQRLRLVFAVVFLPTAILLGLISGRVTRRLFARLDKIAETARQVGAGRFAERIPLSEAEDEFDRLAQTLNQMLERNEALLHALRTTTASLAHDLRTPLTRTFARLEEVSQLLEMDETAQTEGIATRDGMRPALDQAMAEIERLRHTFDALTTIVHAESGISAAFPDSLRYAGLLEDVYDLYAPLAEEQGGSLSLRLHACPPKQRDAEVLGNRQLLFQAVSNLVENSLAHAKPSRSPLTIALFLDYQEATAEHPATWRLGVRDNGSGVSEPIQQRALAGFLHKPAPKSADDSAPESAKDDAPRPLPRPPSPTAWA